MTEEQPDTCTRCGRRFNANGNDGDSYFLCVPCASQIAESLIALSDRNPRVHILSYGRALCGTRHEVMPHDWPEGHTWVSLHEREQATCEECIAQIGRVP
jgi:tRNA(Ile2) C34 agmatinyltransferase TiaS